MARKSIDPTRVQELHAQGLENVGIAAALRCSVRKVGRILRESSTAGAPRGRRPRIDPRRLREMNLKGMSDVQIAKALGCTPANVLYHRRKLGLVAPRIKNAKKIEGYSHDGLLAYIETGSDRGIGQAELNRLAEESKIRERIAGELREWVKVASERLYASYVQQRREKLRRAVLDDATKKWVDSKAKELNASYVRQQRERLRRMILDSSLLEEGSAPAAARPLLTK